MVHGLFENLLVAIELLITISQGFSQIILPGKGLLSSATERLSAGFGKRRWFSASTAQPDFALVSVQARNCLMATEDIGLTTTFGFPLKNGQPRAGWVSWPERDGCI